MIQTAMQLKAKVRKLSNGDSMKAQTFIRNYIMERFLERCSASKYRDHFILKGGMFVASYVGLQTRTTKDIDATIKGLPLTTEAASDIINEIINVPIEDGVAFEIISIKDIMEEHDYQGLRIDIEGYLGNLRQPIQLDISTGDSITPSEIEYAYPLMFEDRTIKVMSYNLETIIGEKMETILARAEANTRMRDYYDIYVLLKEKKNEIKTEILKEAFTRTCKKRNTYKNAENTTEILNNVKTSSTLMNQWENYRKKSFYVGNLEWSDVINAAFEAARIIGLI